MSNPILSCELRWLASIGCHVETDLMGLISVCRADLQATDFNFKVLSREVALENLPPGCFRVSSLDSASGRIATWLMAHRSSVEVEYDVNLLRVSPPLSSSDDHLRVEYADWRGNGATSAVDEREFYHFLSDDGTAVAWYSLVRSEEVAGVFDVGVREDRRGLGIGTAMMGSIGSRTPLFVQTWSSNRSALGCYSAAGYVPLERLVRVVL